MFDKVTNFGIFCIKLTLAIITSIIMLAISLCICIQVGISGAIFQNSDTPLIIMIYIILPIVFILVFIILLYFIKDAWEGWV